MNPFVDTLHFQLRRSTLLMAICLVAHGVALSVAFILAWRTLWAVPLVLLVVANAWQHLRAPMPAWMPADGCFRWTGDDRLHWTDPSGRPWASDCIDAQLIGTLVLRLSLAVDRSRWRRRGLWIACDAVDAPIHRRLRARAHVRGRGRDPDAVD